MIEVPAAGPDPFQQVAARRLLRSSVAAAAVQRQVPGLSDATIAALLNPTWFSVASGRQIEPAAVLQAARHPKGYAVGWFDQDAQQELDQQM